MSREIEPQTGLQPPIEQTFMVGRFNNLMNTKFAVGAATLVAALGAGEMTVAAEPRDAVNPALHAQTNKNTPQTNYEAQSESCLDSAVRGGQPAVQFQRPPNVIGAKVLKNIRIYDHAPRDVQGAPGSCDKYGSRKLWVRPFMENDKGKMVPNGRPVYLARNNNNKVDRTMNLKLKVKYTCEEGAGERRWLLKLPERGAYGGQFASYTTVVKDAYYSSKIC